MSAPLPGPDPTSRLGRVLGPWTVTAIVIGTVIGSGVFKKPQAVAERIPESGAALLVWVLVGLLALLGALTLAEIAIRLPRAGGNYVFLREGYGRWAGFLWGWVEFWIIRSASIAALATIFTESLHDVLKQLLAVDSAGNVLDFWALQGVTVAVVVGLALVNVRGTRWGGGLQLAITVVKVGSLLGILALPWLALMVFTDPAARPDAARLEPVWPAVGPANFWAFAAAFGGAMVSVIWAYHGWMNIAPVAEEVRQPGRNIPLALIVSTLALIALYLGVNLAYAVILPHAQIVAATDTTVAAVFSLKMLGSVGVLVAAAAVMISVFGALNGNLLVGPRLLFAMGDDGLAPRALRTLHPRFGTPALATFVLAGWAGIQVLTGAALTQTRLPVVELAGLRINPNLPAGKPLFDLLTDFAMFGAVTFETLAVATIFAFRRRDAAVTRSLPYRCWGYPVVPALYVTVMACVLASMFYNQPTEALTGVGFIAVGAIVYVAVYRNSAARRG